MVGRRVTTRTNLELLKLFPRLNLLTVAGSDQSVGGEPGETAGGAVQTALLHGQPPVLGASQPQGEMR